jgi:hypothetical protein
LVDVVERPQGCSDFAAGEARVNGPQHGWQQQVLRRPSLQGAAGAAIVCVVHRLRVRLAVAALFLRHSFQGGVDVSTTAN